MPINLITSRASSTSLAFKLVLAGLMFCLSTQIAYTQAAADLSQAKRLFVESLQGGNGATELQASLVKRLRKSGTFEVVDSPDKADAIVRGTGQLWVRGHLTTNSRSPSQNRQAVYGGYLSIELVGKDDETLWSYLVTPSKFSWGVVTDDLSDNLVKQLLAAREAKSPPAAASGRTSNPAPTALHGAGATFPAPLYRHWFESFQQRNPGVHFSYDAVGSEAGLRLLADNQVDFAASDALITELPLSNTAVEFRPFASVLGAVVPIYNLKGLRTDLRFSPQALADIYLGKITKWNDPGLVASNKDAHLPDHEIVVVHRADGSGTTYAWSDFLSKTSPEWSKAVGTGTTLMWPLGIGVDGNDGVADTVRRTPYSIGYVELVHAIQHQLNFGAVRNSAGEYIKADLSSVAAAARGASVAAKLGTVPSITDPPGKGAYPIASFTWLLLPHELADASKRTALLEFLRWMLTAGQRESSALGYAPLPPDLAKQQLETLSNLR